MNQNYTTLLLTAVAISLFPISIGAQEITPKVEASVNYSYLREGATPGYTGTDLTKGIDVNGVLTINRWLGAEFDTSHFSGSQPLIVPLPSGITAGHSTFHTLMGGPRFTYRRNSRVTPYAHILIGGAGIYSGYSVPPPSNPSPPANPTPPSNPSPPANPTPPPSNPNPVSPGPGSPGYPGTPGAPSAPGTANFEPGSNMAFAWAVGGGLNINVNDHFAFQLFQGDYLNTRTDGFSGKPVNNFRIATGVVFRLGSK